ncbi:MAG: biotin/lipoyl-binding protein, partial [Holophaga sp.]|nr:biotin/lipoyl-binding protein [Holophaga sp.]
MKNVRWVILGLIFMLALSACQSASTPALAAAAAPQVNSLVAQGYLQPLRSVDLAFSSGGRVAEVLVKEGDAVKQGQVLVRLELVGVEARQADWVRAEQEVLAAGQAIGTLTDAAAGALVQAKFAVADLEKQIDAAQTAVADAKEPEEGDPDPLVIAQAEARQALL